MGCNLQGDRGVSRFTDLVTAGTDGRLYPRMEGLAGFSVETSVGPSPSRVDKEYTVSLNFTRTTRACDTIPEATAARVAAENFKKELEYLVYSDLAPLIHNLREEVYKASAGSQEVDAALGALLAEVMGR